MSPLIEFEFSINSLTLFAIILFSAISGFMVQRGQIKRKDIRMNRLEKQILEANAEVLEAQKEYCALESRLKDLKIPVITMKHAAKEEVIKELEQDPALVQQKRPSRTGTA